MNRLQHSPHAGPSRPRGTPAPLHPLAASHSDHSPHAGPSRPRGAPAPLHPLAASHGPHAGPSRPRGTPIASHPVAIGHSDHRPHAGPSRPRDILAPSHPQAVSHSDYSRQNPHQSAASGYFSKQDSLQTQMRSCLFSKAEENIKSGLTDDIKCIRNVLLVVLEEYQILAKAFRPLMRVPSQPNAVARARALLQNASNSIREAARRLRPLTRDLITRGAQLDTEVSRPDKHPWAHALVNRKMPLASVASGFILSVGNVAYTTAAAGQIEQHAQGSAILKVFWALSGVIFGSTAGVVIAHVGSEAEVFKEDARQTTKAAVEAILKLLGQFSEDIEGLRDYWLDTHIKEIRHNAFGGPLNPDQITRMFEREIENYSQMMGALDRHIPMKGTTPGPSPVQLYKQHRRLQHPS